MAAPLPPTATPATGRARVVGKSGASPAPGRPLRERARSARRRALLEAAEAVFAQRGFSGATMSEIAGRAGYSAGNLYNVFEGKDALFAEVISARADQILELVRRALDGSHSLGTIIDRFVDATLQLVETHRRFFVMLTQASPDFDWHRPHPDTRSGQDVRRDLDAQLEGVFLSAMERGEIPRGNPRPYACLLEGSLSAHVAHWIRNGQSREELWGPADDLRRFLRRGLGVATDPR